MSRAGRVVLIVGILISIAAGLAVFILLVSSQPQPEQVPTTKLVIAFQNIPARSQIAQDQIGVADWPRTVPTPIGSISNPSDLSGKLASAPIYPGQPILDKMLVDPSKVKETHSTAAYILEPGTVAMALPVTTKSNVAEALQAGDRVDMLVTLHSTANSGAAANYAATNRLLSDVLILQVGPWPPPEGRAASPSSTTVVTLQLKEQDALVLQHVQEYASSFSLVLRPANDHDLVQLEPVTLDYINEHFRFNLPK